MCLEAHITTVEPTNGVRVGSVAQADGDGGNITLVAPDALIVTGTNGDPDPATNRGSRVTASSFFTSVGNAGSIAIQAGSIDLADGARVSTSTSGIGDGGSIDIDATGPVTLTGARGDGSGSAIKASTEVEASEAGAVDAPRTGSAGAISIRAPRLTLTDGAEIVSNTSLAGDGGQIALDVGALRIADARIASESTAQGADAGNAGAVRVDAESITIDAGGRISAATIDGRGGSVTLRGSDLLLAGGTVSAASTGAGQGGDLLLIGKTIRLLDGGNLSASATGLGNAGALSVTAADDLTMLSSSIRTSASASAGGDIAVAAGRRLRLVDSLISAEARGVTANADGGNISIDPDFVILDTSSVIARANAGNGGNISIRAGFFVSSAESQIDASSNRGISGDVSIESPNQITDTVIPLETPAPQVGELLTQRCIPQLAERRSSFTVETQPGAPFSVGGFLASPLPREASRSNAAARGDGSSPRLVWVGAGGRALCADGG